MISSKFPNHFADDSEAACSTADSKRNSRPKFNPVPEIAIYSRRQVIGTIATQTSAIEFHRWKPMSFDWIYRCKVVLKGRLFFFDVRREGGMKLEPAEALG